MKNPTQKAILSIIGPEPMSALDIANQINFPREKIYYHLSHEEHTLPANFLSGSP